MGRRDNFLNELISREIGGCKRKVKWRMNVIDQSRLLMRYLVLSSARTFSKVSRTIVSNGQVLYDDGKLFLTHKGTDCVDCYAIRDGAGYQRTLSSQLKRIYSIPRKPFWKDQDTWISPIGNFKDRPQLNDSSLRPSLFVLRDDKNLSRYDLDTGKELQRLFLFPKRKYVSLSLNASSSPNVIVKSTKDSELCDRPDCDHRSCRLRSISFITFTYPPLKFETHLEIEQDIFGMQLQDAVIGDGIVIVITSFRTAKLFSLEYILKKFYYKDFWIGQTVLNPYTQAEEIVGQEPVGFPINVFIRHRPPELYSINCHDLDVAFNNFLPPLCITTSKGFCYKVYNLDNSECISIKKRGLDIDNDLVFHPDESRRLIHLAGRHMHIQEIDPQPPLRSREVFRFNAGPLDTVSGSEESDEDYNPGGYEAIYDFEDELNILAVLSAQELTPDFYEFGDNQMRVRLEAITLFDNKTYKKLRTIPLKHDVKCGASDRGQLSLAIDRDLILIRLKGLSKTRSLVWRLCESAENNQESSSRSGVEGKMIAKQKAGILATRPTRSSTRRR